MKVENSKMEVLTALEKKGIYGGDCPTQNVYK